MLQFHSNYYKIDLLIIIFFVIVQVPDIEFLDENDKKNTEEIAHNKYHNFPKEIPISFDERRKELDEVNEFTLLILN